MDPFTLAMILGPLAGGVAGHLFGQGDRAKADALREKALADLEGIHPMDLQAALSEYLPRSELGGITTDPRFQGTELEAMDRMLAIGRGGGTTAQDEAGLARLKDDANQHAQAQRQGIEADLARRGQLSSGHRVRLMAHAGQEAAQAANRGAYDLAAAREQRADQAMRTAAGIAGGLDERQYGRAAAAATANDRIAQFNQGRRDQLRGQHFNQQMDLAGAKSGAYGTLAAAKDRRAAETGAMWTGVGRGVGQGGAALAENERDQDWMDFLRGRPKTS